MGMDPRQMAMMMRKLGIEVRELDDVEEVVVRTAQKEYRFRKASVSVMKAQGTETWQVQGKPEVLDRAARAPTGSAAPAANTAASPARPSPGPVEVPDADVLLVMEQAGCSREAAREALVATGGDLAEAILRLKR